MRGWSALGFAIEHPDRVISLTLADTTAGIFTPAVEKTLSDYGKAIAAGSRLYEMPLGKHPAIGSQLLDEDLTHSFLFTRLGSLTDPPSPAAILPLLMATGYTDRVSRVNVPIPFIVGENDPIVSPSLIETASLFIPGSRVEIVQNTGPSPYFELPAVWNDLVAKFLQESCI